MFNLEKKNGIVSGMNLKLHGFDIDGEENSFGCGGCKTAWRCAEHRGSGAGARK